jgi:hypothetical protein
VKKPLEHHIHDYERTRNSHSHSDGLPPWDMLLAIFGLISALTILAFVVVFR